MKKTTSQLLRAAALLSASNPDAVERSGSDEKVRVFVQAILLVLTPLLGIVGAAYAVHDILAAQSQAASVPAPLLVLLPAAAGLVFAFVLFAIDWMIVRFLDGARSVMNRAAVIAPRLLLAAFSALLISVPVMTGVFEEEVRKALIDGAAGVATGFVAAAEPVGFVGKVVALERLATQNLEIGLLTLCTLALLLLISASPVLVKLLTVRPATANTRFVSRAGRSR